ncbi:MAG: hypothetical protein HY273_12680 [Gammaproteobacteria bacterium]|nr:hypothetical protein [Gammaproteobacteria bacterium]
MFKRIAVPARLILAASVFFAAVFVVGKDANATPAFARATGAACNKCHSEMFPRLNERGERYLRNGFQVRGEEGVSLDAPGQNKEQAADEGKKIASDLYLNNLSNLFSIYGVVDALSKDTDSKNIHVGAPTTLSLLATGTLAKDIPVFMEMELDPESGAVEADRFFIGATNLGGSTVANLRTGSLDPTEWTSFPSIAAEAFKAKTDHVGVYSGPDAGKGGFAHVGSGLTPRHAIEYYGYADNLFWATAVANPPESEFGRAPADQRNLDFWAVGRLDVPKTGSVSVLYYNSHFVDEASAWVDTRVLGIAGNLRLPSADLLAQYTRDSGTDNRPKIFGFTLQANIPFTKQFMGIARYDMTDNGADQDSKESVLSLGAMYKPAQNLKVTAALTSELKRADTGDPAQVAKSNGFNINLHYAL